MEPRRWPAPGDGTNITCSTPEGEFTLGCESCFFRNQYDKNPGSWLGRLWHWHTRWCPGWKAYMKSLPDQEREQLAARYGLKT